MLSKKSNNFFNLKLIVFVLTIVLVTSCAHVYNVPNDLTITYPENDKINLNIELFLSEELQNAKWEKKVMGDTFTIPLGEPFCQNSIDLTKEIFSAVKVNFEGVNNKLNNSDKNIDVQAILKPTMVLASRTIGATAFGDSLFTVMIEWTLTDLNRDIIWVDTVKGEGKAPSGNVFSMKAKAKKQIKQAVESLFLNSFNAVSLSPEIREFSYSL